MDRCLSLFLFILISPGIEAQELALTHLQALDFKNMMEEKPGILVDVRTEWEYLGDHIPGALQINYYGFDFRKKILALPKDRPIYLYCRTGYRSRRTSEILAANGYTEIYNLKKGINQWNSVKLPTSKNKKE